MVSRQLVIVRRRNQVVLTLNMQDDYAAIETYEKLVVQARKGFVLLDVEAEVHDDHAHS